MPAQRDTPELNTEDVTSGAYNLSGGAKLTDVDNSRLGRSIDMAAGHWFVHDRS